MKKTVWYLAICLLAVAVLGASDRFSSHQEDDWKVDWVLVQDASNHKVYDVTVQNLDVTSRDFDLRVLLDLADINADIDLYEWTATPVMVWEPDIVCNNETRTVDNETNETESYEACDDEGGLVESQEYSWSPIPNPTKVRGTDSLAKNYGPRSFTGSSIKTYRVVLTNFNPILYDARLGFIERGEGTLFHPLIDSTHYEADFTSDGSTNSSFSVTTDLLNSSDEQFNVSTPFVCENSNLGPDLDRKYGYNVSTGSENVYIVGAVRYSGCEFDNLTVINATGSDKLKSIAQAEFVTDTVFFDTPVAMNSDGQSLIVVLAGPPLINEGYCHNGGNDGTISYPLQGNHANITNSAQWTSGYFYFEDTAYIHCFQDILFNVSGDAGSYITGMFNTGGNHNTFTSVYTESGNTVTLNLTVEGEEFQDVVSGKQYNLSMNPADGNTSFNYTVSLSSGSVFSYLNISFGLLDNADETEGRTAIEQGISNALSKSADATDRQVYIRRSNGSQQLGLFDKYVESGTKRWAFNYNVNSTGLTGIVNVTPVFYVWEGYNMTTSTITSVVQGLIEGTD